MMHCFYTLYYATGRLKKFTRSAGDGIKRPIFKTVMLIYQSKANLDGKILLGEITNHLDPESRKMLAGGMLGNKDSSFHFGP